jgi:hypothetical protein
MTTISKSRMSEAASMMGKKRWKGISKAERSRLAPRNGGRPAKYTVKCTRYPGHHFSPKTQRCPCGYVRDASLVE